MISSIKWVVFLLILSGTFGSGMVLVRLYGQQKPNAPTYYATANCPQPCWQGLQPGFSRVDTTNMPPISIDYQVSFSTRQNGLVRNIRLNLLNDDVLLGDVMLVWGKPSHGRLTWRTALLDGQAVARIGADLYFAEGLIVVRTIRDDCLQHFSPDMIVREIVYYAPSLYGNVVPLETPRWHGFSTHAIRATNLAVC